MVFLSFCMFPSTCIECHSITSYLDTIQITLILRSNFDAPRTPKFLFGLVQTSRDSQEQYIPDYQKGFTCF